MSENPIQQVDPAVAALIQAEDQRQRETLRLIPSENYASAAVLAACSSSMANKYSEGYPGRRYYHGQEQIDQLESLTINRAKALFGAEHVNVQPYSGSPANLAVYLAFLKPGDRILSMSLPHGGHLTHGWKVTLSGKFFDVAQYGLRREDHRIDMDEVARLAREHKPKLIICGASAYPRIIDFAAFKEIADEVGAFLLADIAHISGLVAGGVHPSPVPFADVVSTTTHKTLRGPRGGMLMCTEEHQRKMDRAVCPGLQGGPHNHTTAGLAIALKEALSDDFKRYARQVVDNAATLADALLSADFELVSGGTENHLILVDLTRQGIPGKTAADALESAGIVCNANSVPFDPRGPFDPSGIRIGTPALTSRGMGAEEMRALAVLMSKAIDAREDNASLDKLRSEVAELCAQFPAPGL